MRLGLFLYDHLAPRKKLPGTETIKLTRHPAGQALKPGFDTAFVYSDCWVEDSRMVALNAIDAFEKGADIRVRTKLVSARRDGDVWVASLQNVETGETQDVRAKVIVNAGGPFVADVLNAKLGLNTKKNVRLVKGSHIVVPKLFDTKEAFILQNTDKRIVFAIPYQEKFTLIGTTDIPVEAVPDKKVTISDDEIQYLCNVVNHFFKKSVTPADVVWTYSGVRPLFDDGSSNASAVTRDYVFDMDAPQGQAPVLSIFGGKITTFRKLAEHALDELKTYLPDHEACMDGRCQDAGRRHAGCGFRPLLRHRAPALAFPARTGRSSPRPRLRHADRGASGLRQGACRSRRGFRCRPDGGGSRLPGAPRMGAQRRGHSLAPVQARSACAG